MHSVHFYVVGEGLAPPVMFAGLRDEWINVDKTAGAIRELSVPLDSAKKNSPTSLYEIGLSILFVLFWDHFTSNVFTFLPALASANASFIPAIS